MRRQFILTPPHRKYMMQGAPWAEEERLIAERVNCTRVL